MSNESTNEESVEKNSISDIDRVSQEKLLQEKLQSQNLPLGIAAGLGASIIGAAIWAGITYATEHQIGWMAVGVGFLVGFAIKFAGKGYTMPFGISGALFSLFGCVLGNIFTLFLFFASQKNIAIFDVFSHINFSAIPKVMMESFQPMDLLFYGIAIYEGYRFSINTIAEDTPAG